MSEDAERFITLSFDDGWISQFRNAFPLMKERGMVGTFYIIGRVTALRYLMGVMSPIQLRVLQDAGNEIASHSATHRRFTDLTDEEIVEECVKSKKTLESLGLTVNNFRYPKGESNDHIDSIVSRYYRSGCYGRGYVKLPITTWKIPTLGAWGRDLPVLRSRLDYAYANDLWLNIGFHDISDEKTTGNGNVTVRDFTQLLDYIQYKNFTTLTVNQVLNLSLRQPVL